MRKICFLLLLAAWGARAEDIVLTSGIIYQNVQIIIETEQGVTYATSAGSTYTIAKTAIKEIIRTPFRSAEKSVTTSTSSREKHYYKRPNLHYLLYSVPTAVLSWEYFSQISQINTSIKLFDKLGEDTKSLKTSRSEKTIVGVVLLGVTVWNTVFALQRVEVTADGQMIGLSYHF